MLSGIVYINSHAQNNVRVYVRGGWGGGGVSLFILRYKTDSYGFVIPSYNNNIIVIPYYPVLGMTLFNVDPKSLYHPEYILCTTSILVRN